LIKFIGKEAGYAMSLIAVIDVESTGLNPFMHDRVIELAVITNACKYFGIETEGKPHTAR